jgi:hypothetical protein
MEKSHKVKKIPKINANPLLESMEGNYTGNFTVAKNTHYGHERTCHEKYKFQSALPIIIKESKNFSENY